MKQVWVKRATCSCTLATTASAALPTLTTAMPEPRSIKELSSASTRTPPPAAVTTTGSGVPRPRQTAPSRRSIRALERGPGISVTRRRSWGREGPPAVGAVIHRGYVSPHGFDTVFGRDNLEEAPDPAREARSTTRSEDHDEVTVMTDVRP